jgi:putative FmdB family regulatory protein
LSILEKNSLVEFRGKYMPIYEYQCAKCGHQLESLQKMSDPALQDCPVCHESSLHKKVSAAGFRLSGGGWYETDFKSGQKKNIAGDKDKSGSTSAETKSSESKSDSKSSDSKPASTKSETKSPT